MVEIILLAAVALFVGLRLFSVLGERTGHEQEPLPRPVERPKPIVQAPEPVADGGAKTQSEIDSVVSPMADFGIRKIAGADPNFDVDAFLVGAQAAYRMILEAFWQGDDDVLADLTGPDVQAAFGQAIKDREADGLTFDNRLVAIERTIIEEASLDQMMARIKVRFDADIAGVTRNADDEIIAGSMSDAIPTHDSWTFARNVRESDPNWLLVETDEAQ